MSAESTFGKDDHRSNRLVPSLLAATDQILREKIQPLANQYNTTLTGLALSYILSYPEISVVIPGIRKPDQVAGNTEPLVQLTEKDKNYLASLFESDWQPVMEMMEKQG
jgi:aryl-alcohol dehydrogenase-like predicted oxidoreductase